jgi:hypothetical protein
MGFDIADLSERYCDGVLRTNEQAKTHHSVRKKFDNST